VSKAHDLLGGPECNTLTVTPNGGADGVASTGGDDTLFAVRGLFFP
jgi:hypothetical protein